MSSSRQLHDGFIYKRAKYGEGLDRAYPHPRFLPDPRASFAMQIIERWALVAAEADGEDSAGRAKPRRLDPAEVVRIACEISDGAYAEFERREWLVEVPTYEEIQERAKEQEDKN